VKYNFHVDTGSAISWVYCKISTIYSALTDWVSTSLSLKSPIVVLPALLQKLQEELDCKKCDDSVFCVIHFCLVSKVEDAFLTYVGV